MSGPAHRLQNRLMLVIGAFVLMTAFVFAFYAMVFTYSVEDAFLDAALEHEAAAQLEEKARSGQWAVPRDRTMKIYPEVSSLPEDLRAVYLQEPWRHEFPGDEGRHYHLRVIDVPESEERVWLVAEVSSQLVVRPLRGRIMMLFAVSGTLLVAIALLAAYWVARRTTAPLSLLAREVDRITPDNLEVGLSRNVPDDEIGILARGLDNLIARIHAFIAREQEFTRDASHELRTPLAVIRSAIEGLLREPGLSASGMAQLQYLRQSSMQLEQTVTSLLSLARDERGDTVEAVALLPTIERVIVEQAPLLEGKPVKVDVAVGAREHMRIAPSVLHILLSNLIGNAFAHTAEGEVRIDVMEGWLQIVNTADGSDPALKWREPKAFSKREGSNGLGIGLGIVRRLCDRHGIEVRIDSVEGRAIARMTLRQDA